MRFAFSGLIEKKKNDVQQTHSNGLIISVVVRIKYIFPLLLHTFIFVSARASVNKDVVFTKKLFFFYPKIKIQIDRREVLAR